METVSAKTFCRWHSILFLSEEREGKEGEEKGWEGRGGDDFLDQLFCIANPNLSTPNNANP
jgi:hypothetical protein